MFDLKRPCVNCPFRKDQGRLFGMYPERLEEIRNAPAFQCHKTVDYTADGGHAPGERPQQCAGLMMILQREGIPNQIMQVAERFGVDLSGLDPDGVTYATWAEAVADHTA